jgi:hypothetical protein
MVISQTSFPYNGGFMRWNTPLLAACLLALLAGSAVAAPALVPPEPPAGVVAPGQVVVTTLPAMPRGAEEFELLLLPESGPPVRLTPEQRVGPRTVRWRMPAVAGHRARLVLHAGDEHDEWESAPSAPFALAGLPASELPRLLRGRSEAGWPLEPGDGPAPAGLAAAPDAPSLVPGRALASAVEPPPAPVIAPAPGASVPFDVASPFARTTVVVALLANTPAFRPLRN